MSSINSSGRLRAIHRSCSASCELRIWSSGHAPLKGSWLPTVGRHRLPTSRGLYMGETAGHLIGHPTQGGRRLQSTRTRRRAELCRCHANRQTPAPWRAVMDGGHRDIQSGDVPLLEAWAADRRRACRRDRVPARLHPSAARRRGRVVAAARCRTARHGHDATWVSEARMAKTARAQRTPRLPGLCARSGVDRRCGSLERQRLEEPRRTVRCEGAKLSSTGSRAQTTDVGIEPPLLAPERSAEALARPASTAVAWLSSRADAYQACRASR
jgi:hypothetical protein